MSRFLRFLFALTVIYCGAVHAAEVEGVNVPDTINVDGNSAPLSLNGAGIRSKFFVDVYVGALYLQARADTVDSVLAQTSGNRVFMHFLYDEVSAEKLIDAWNDGFNDNTDEDALANLKDRIATFNGWFPTAVRGDEILLDYLPGKGTRVTIKGEVKGIIPGADFNQALLRIWLGEYPADGSLKDAMLGG